LPRTISLDRIAQGSAAIDRPIRIKVPTTLGFLRLNALVREFADLHPDIDMEVLLLDGPMNLPQMDRHRHHGVSGQL